MRVVLLLLCVAALTLSAGTALAQAPGTPVAGCQPPLIVFDEPPVGTEGQEHVTQILPCEVFTGAVILFEDPAKDPRDPHNWSDVLVFWYPGLPQPGTTGIYGTFVSDTEDAAGNSNGITDADFAAAGLPFPVALVAGLPTNVYLPENPNGMDNFYSPGGPGTAPLYDLRSDPPEHPVPTGATTWGRIKGLYH